VYGVYDLFDVSLVEWGTLWDVWRCGIHKKTQSQRKKAICQ